MSGNANGTQGRAEVSRREFLAGTAAVSAGALVPIGRGYPIPPRSDEVVVVLENLSSGLWEPESFHATKADAAQRFRFSSRKTKTEIWPFVPLDTDERFVACEMEWALPMPHLLGLGKLSDARAEKLIRQRSELNDSLPLPTSLLDLPPGIAGMAEHLIDATDRPTTREQALAWAADWNAKITDEGGKVGMPWFVVVELGRAPTPELYTVTLHANGIGDFDRTERRTVRLVVPTEAERAAYPVEWEGGDA